MSDHSLFYKICTYSPQLTSPIVSFDTLMFQIVEDEVLCVHGGLSPYIKSLDQIRVIDRNQEIPHQGERWTE